MKILKSIALIVLIHLNFSYAYSQEIDKYGYEYKEIEKEKILLPTWDNVFNTITMPTNLFKQLMSEYGYELDKNIKGVKYIKNIKNATVSVEQIENGILFDWNQIELSTSKIETTFKQYYKETMEGAKVYIIKKEDVEIIVLVKNNASNTGYLFVKLNNPRN